MADQYDERLQQLYTDEHGDQWTAAQLKAAAEAKVRDEQGQGSFGGLEEANPEPTGQENADVNKMVNEVQQPATPQRELNPLHFGQFFKDNIFNGNLGTGYVTGKRPMNLADYATDVAIGYGGGDLGKRNAALRKAAGDSSLNSLKAAEAGQKIKTERARETQAGAQTTKTRVETEKVTGDLIQQMMMDLDSDLWAGELKALQKEHGVNLRPGITSMVERMAQQLHQAGVAHPAEVLQNPDGYAPELVNRVRHTMRLLNDQIEQSRARDLTAEKEQSAMGIAKSEESRKQMQNTGYEDAMSQLQAQIDANPEDANVRRQNEARIATIRAGGPAAQKVLEDMSGLGQGSQGSRAWIQTRNAAVAAIQKRKQDPSYQPADDEIKAEMNRIEATGAAQKTTATKAAGLIAEGKGQVARGLGLIDNMRAAVKRFGLAKSAVGATTVQPLRMMWAKISKDPTYATLSAFPATLSNISRSLGERGVLTDTDLQRVISAVEPRTTDTAATYEARLSFVQQAMVRGQQELEKAEAAGTMPQPVDLTDMTYDGDPLPPETQGGGAAGAGDKQGEADAIRAEQDPAKRRAMAQAFMKKYGGGR